jgi:hypothetical protein
MHEAAWFDRVAKLTRGGDRRRGRHDSGKPLGSLKACELGGLEPVRLSEFVIERNLAGDEASGERQYDEMPFYPSGLVAPDRLAIPGKSERLDLEPGLFADLAHDGFRKRFAEFDAAAGKRVEAAGGRLRAANDQHSAVTKDGGTDGEIGPRGISPR